MDFPLRLLQPFLGPRIIKTGLAVFLSLAVFHWFGSGYAAFGAVAAVMAVQPSISKAREVLRQQLLGNGVAGVVAALIGLWLPVNPLTMALAAVLALGLLVRFKLSEAAGLAVVVVLFVMDRPDHDFLLYSAARMGVIVGGMAIGHLVNRLVKPPDVVSRVRDEVAEGTRGVSRFIDRLVLALSTPEDYEKEQIKQDAAAVQKHLSAARALLEIGGEDGDPARVAVLKKANASMFIFVEAIMDVHKLLLEAGGLADGPELESLTAVLRALAHYQEVVMKRALDGAAAQPEAARAYEEALSEFQHRVELLIDRRDRRHLGLLLHQALAEIRHMGWRMSSLARLTA